MSTAPIIADMLTVSIATAIEPTLSTGEAAVAIACPDVSFSGGDTYRAYATAVAAAADSDLAAADVAMVTAAFNQGSVNRVYVVTWDDAGGDDPSDGLTAAELDGLRPGISYLGLCIRSRTIADIVDASTWAQSRPVIFYGQSSDSSWLDSGVPAGFTATSNTHTAVIYEDTDTTYADAMWAGRIAAGMATTRPGATIPGRPGAMARIVGASEYTTPITDTQAGFLAANHCNWHAPINYSSSARYVKGGTDDVQPVMVDGTAWAVMFTAVWAEVLITRELTELVTGVLGSDRDIPAGLAGVAMVRGKLEADVFGQLLRAEWLQQTEDYPAGWDFTYTVSGSTLTAAGDLAYLGVVGSIGVTGRLVS